MKALFDTNLLIDYLQGIVAARDELARYQERAISIITWMEVLVGTSPSNEAMTRAFLDDFALIDLNHEVAERAVTLRKTHRMRLPDAIIWASAQIGEMLLVTRNTKDFAIGAPDVRIPYQR